MAFDRHGNLLPSSSDGGVAAARGGARSRSRGRSRGRPSRPSSSGPPSTGGQPFPGAPWGSAVSPTKGSRSPPEEAVVNAPGSLHSPLERLQSPRSRSRGCRTHSTGRRTTRGLAAVVPQLPFGLGGGGRMDKDGNGGGSNGGKGPSHRGQSLGGSRDRVEGGHTLSRRRVSNGSFHSSAGRRPSEFSESSSSLQDVPQSSHGPLHRSGSGSGHNPNRSSHGGKASAANQNGGNNQPKKSHKMILVDEKDRESYRRMAAPGLAADDILPPPRCMTEQQHAPPSQRAHNPPPGQSKVDEIVRAYKCLAVPSKSVSNSTAESSTAECSSDTTRSESESPRNPRPSVVSGLRAGIPPPPVAGAQAMPPPPPRGRPPQRQVSGGNNAPVTSPGYDRAVMYPPPPTKGNSFRSAGTNNPSAKGGSFRSAATNHVVPARGTPHGLPSLPFAGDVRGTTARGFAKRPPSAQEGAAEVLGSSETTRRRPDRPQQQQPGGEGDAAAGGGGDGSGNGKMLSPLAQSILAKSRRNFEEARAAVASSAIVPSQPHEAHPAESDSQPQQRPQAAGPQLHQPASRAYPHQGAGGCPGYKIGDTLRDPSHMSEERTAESSLAAVESLQNHDFCFLRRSDGSYTYAILAYRTMEWQRPGPSTPGGDVPPAEEECMTFVVSGTGCTKMIKRRQWTDFVRRCAVPVAPAVAAADPRESTSTSQPTGELLAGRAATTEALERAAEAEENIRRIRREFYATRPEPGGGFAPPASIEFGAGGDDDISVVSDVSYAIAQAQQSAAQHARTGGGFAPSQPVIME